MDAMTTGSILYAVGALMEGWLAVMLHIAGRALRGEDERWSRPLAAGFAFSSARAALMASGYGNVAYDAEPKLLTATLSDLSIAFIAAGLMNVVGLAPATMRRAWTVIAPMLLALWLLTLVGGITRGAANVAGIAFVLGCGGLFVHAMLREPRTGHGLVVLATLSYPGIVIPLKMGLLPFGLLPIGELVPLIAIGIAVLTTGLVRSNQRTQREAARAREALAARELAEAQLRAANELLEQRVAERTATLHETIEGLESFNQTVSHDLRGPLGGIAGVAGLAREEITAGRPEAADRMLAAIVKQANHSMAMVGALLSLARATSAQPQRQRVDAARMVQELAAELACDRPVTPQVVVQPLPAAQADPQLLRQVFANLLGNACKFARPGDDARIEVGHAPTPRGDAWYVRDNGVGFSNADAQRMFKPFQRLHGAAYEGHGVGLSIVRRIVEHHGGQVWADGMPDRGATFWFTLGEQ